MRGRFRKKGERVLPIWVEPTPAAVIRRISQLYAIDPRLIPTDRHMQRWAAGEGAGLPDADAALLPTRLRLDPLPIEIAVVTDQVVLRAPPFVRDFADRWYRYCWDVKRIGERLGGDRQRVIEERSVVLAYLLGGLTAAGVRLSVWEPVA